MNGSDSIKKAAISKAKQVASSATNNGSAGKKRRKQVSICAGRAGADIGLTVYRLGVPETNHYHRGPADSERKFTKVSECV